MVSKLISAVISSFRLRLRQASQKGFHRSSTTFQFFLLAFLVSQEKLKFRHERVLEPSLSIINNNNLVKGGFCHYYVFMSFKFNPWWLLAPALAVVLAGAACQNYSSLDNLTARSSINQPDTGVKVNNSRPATAAKALPLVKAVEHTIKILPVPFMVQAPYGNWGLPYQEACEEAAMIMAAEYFKGNKNLRLSAAEADKAILQLVEWQKQQRGFYEDTTAAEVAAIMTDYFNLTATVAVYNATAIRQAITAGKLVLVPAAGRKLGNPYFRRPGPLYHMLVIKGFDGDEFITNDPGTKRGESYRYPETVMASAVHDWNGGKVEEGEPVMIIVSSPRN
ncbi:MAG: C39 family peptidase [Patescibacteria group bacterium]